MALVALFLEVGVALDGPDPAGGVDVNRHRGDDIRLLTKERQLEALIENLRLSPTAHARNCKKKDCNNKLPGPTDSH